ncbi:hypothetical protein COCMIDRAFT_35894 [Bipolaris oryzae ATCC 44560]|uniref:Uncharacterized protein n=1 Tax=Bipolaris oryzae ATCC 44560 TaxID=930090 RepID=W6ZS64_COCMI|nr:uncharacterized protein COCMIDRAFT_35894 [Bipolaris oryzae ATCC 44560]EUC46541.1 hypothetical protein COCMIDRAFT_35894 [Bipolaris oryzae ATCC 44560]
MEHGTYIRRPGEDWAGITNPKERKRLQNRLNKRVCYQFDWLVCAAVSPFGCNGPIRDARSVTLLLERGTVPGNLVPTVVQLSIRHHPWLDLFPLPRMRDNLLLATNSYLSPEEEQEPFDDIMDSGRGKHEWTGLVVWGEPWDPQNWEVSKPFLEKWYWLMIGCPEIIDSTNRWRRLRGEKPLSTPGFIVEEVEDGDYNEGARC